MYDPTDPAHREELGEKMRKRLEQAGFSLEKKRSSGSEDVYMFQHRKDPGLRIRVFTSTVHGRVRAKDADAIRITMIYKQQKNKEGKEIPLGKMPIIQRSPKATIDTIVERVIDRAREAYKKINKVDRCPKCSAPMAISKKGKPYCSELCWLD